MKLSDEVIIVAILSGLITKDKFNRITNETQECDYNGNCESIIPLFNEDMINRNYIDKIMIQMHCSQLIDLVKGSDGEIKSVRIRNEGISLYRMI